MTNVPNDLNPMGQSKLFHLQGFGFEFPRSIWETRWQPVGKKVTWLNLKFAEIESLLRVTADDKKNLLQGNESRRQVFSNHVLIEQIYWLH